jgi:hypothetical protein
MPDTAKLLGGQVIGGALKELRHELKTWPVEVVVKTDHIVFITEGRQFLLHVVGERSSPKEKNNSLPLDYLVRMPAKVAAYVLGKLGLNGTVFARKCEVSRLKKSEAKQFLDRFHFMGGTEAAYCYGLYFKQDLLAVSTFSKGRKMRRLKENERSFELIRFCTAPGITVTGGLSKLMKSFCEKHGAAEIMTYVDKQFSSGAAFLRAGFKLHEETAPHQFLVNKSSFQRAPFNAGKYDSKKFYVTEDAGNIKMLFSCRQG